MYNLLLVEDEKPLLEKISGHINWEEHGYKVYTARNGKEALNILNNVDIDILVTDIKMPDITGIELIERVKGKNSDITIVIISGHAEFEYAQQSIRLGVTDYLLKPFHSSRLLEVVNRARQILVKRRQEREELARFKRELKRLLPDNDSLNNLINSFFKRDRDDLFREHSLIIKNESIFTELKNGQEKDLVAAINKLFDDVAELKIERDSIFFIINTIVLLTLKDLKEMGFKLEEVIGLLELYNVSGDITRIPGEAFKNWLIDFMIRVNRFIIRKKSEDQELIYKIKEIISVNLSQGLTLNQLAERFNMSNSGLSQLFRKYNGKNFSEYLDEVRINRAKELLKTTGKKIYEIAGEVGFEDPYYFSSWFKKRTGVSPTTYRDNFTLFE